MAGPIFSIAPSQNTTAQVIAAIGAAARSISANRQAAQQMKANEEKSRQAAATEDRNFKIREANLTLERERFNLEKQREANIDKERQSRNEARTNRDASQKVSEGQADTRLKIAAFRALSQDDRAAISNANRQIADKTKQFPLESDRFDLTEFQGKTAQQIASTVESRRLRFGSIDQIDREMHQESLAAGGGGLPKLVVAEQQMLAAQEALRLRKEQQMTVGDALGHQFVGNNPSRQANLKAGLLSDLSGGLGIEVDGFDLSPTGEESIQKAGSIQPSDNQLQPTTDASTEPAAAPVTFGGAQQAANLNDRLTRAFKGNNQEEINTALGEAKRLDRSAQLELFKQLSASVGNARAQLIFGRE